MESSHDVFSLLGQLRHHLEFVHISDDKVKEGQSFIGLSVLIRDFNNLVVSLSKSFFAQLRKAFLILELIVACSESNFEVTTVKGQGESSSGVLDHVKGDGRIILLVKVRNNGISELFVVSMNKD